MHYAPRSLSKVRRYSLLISRSGDADCSSISSIQQCVDSNKAADEKGATKVRRIL